MFERRTVEGLVIGIRRLAHACASLGEGNETWLEMFGGVG